MFSGCSSLKSINLSNFVTSSVLKMDRMFYECDSLNFLDLSNFNMIKCQSYDNMFSNIDSIKFINLYNFKNDKIIKQIFNTKDKLFVCQKDNIISNSNSYI